MPIMYKPNPLPSELNYTPPTGLLAPVSEGDSFSTLIEEYAPLKERGLTALDLCYYNFKTRKPAEINWYLKHKMGLWKASRDGKNFMFSGPRNIAKTVCVWLPCEGTDQGLPLDEYPIE